MLKHKTFIVTGAAKGIGRALAVKLDELGANLILVDIDTVELKLLSDSLLTPPLCLNFSVSDQAAWLDAKIQIDAYMASAQKSQYIHGIINNAGIAHDSVLTEKMSTDDFKKVMDINFYGVLYGTQTFLTDLQKQEESWVVNISSIFGSTGIAKLNAYCASKFAVKGFTESLRMEAKAFFPHVCISLVQPGGIKTDIATHAIKVEDGNLDKREKEVSTFNRQLRTTPEQAALSIVNGIMKKQQRILIGADAKLMDMLARLMPVKYTTLFLKHLKNIGLFND